jgi:hypothetical protein
MTKGELIFFHVFNLSSFIQIDPLYNHTRQTIPNALQFYMYPTMLKMFFFLKS